MFNNLAPNDAEDIFADTDKPAAIPGQPQAPVQSQAQAQPQYGDPRLQPYNPAAAHPTMAMPAPGDEPESDGGHSRAAKMLKVLLILIISLGALGAAAYFAYTKLLNGKLPLMQGQKQATTTPTTTTDQVKQPTTPIDNQVPAVIPPISTSTETTSSSTSPGLGTDIASSSIPAAPDADADGLSDKEEIAIGTNPNLSDTDGDGLTDYEEVAIYKTNPLKADTDGDGLTDYEEVKTYKTDPNKADTDGDGYTDGAEVKAGFNPNGPGKMPK